MCACAHRRRRRRAGASASCSAQTQKRLWWEIVLVTLKCSELSAGTSLRTHLDIISKHVPRHLSTLQISGWQAGILALGTKH